MTFSALPPISVKRVTVLGAGAWGTTLAILATEVGHSVTLVAHSPDSAAYMQGQRRHPSSLPGIVIPDRVNIASGDLEAIDHTDVIVLAAPTQRLREAAKAIGAAGLSGCPIISVAKGLEIGSQLRPTQVIESVLGSATTIAALSGPNLAVEVAQRRPATSVIAHSELSVAEDLAAIFHSPRFRVYHGVDVIGVEIGGALKNVIAIGAGIADGLDAGDNAKAAFITRGIAEIARIGSALGADPLTFAGLSGVGDLIATCTSRLSRNHRVGRELASGRPLNTILREMMEVAEGVPTTRAAFQLGRSLGVETPIVDEMHQVLFERTSVEESIRRLMARERTIER